MKELRDGTGARPAPTRVTRTDTRYANWLLLRQCVASPWDQAACRRLQHALTTRAPLRHQLRTARSSSSSRNNRQQQQPAAITRRYASQTRDSQPHGRQLLEMTVGAWFPSPSLPLLLPFLPSLFVPSLSPLTSSSPSPVTSSSSVPHGHLTSCLCLSHFSSLPLPLKSS